REAIDNVVTSTEYVEAPDACQAIVAAEVIAAALGRATAATARHAALPAWIARVRPRLEPGLATQAADALAGILAADSGLRELWEDSNEFDEWRASVEDLEAQLRAD